MMMMLPKLLPEELRLNSTPLLRRRRMRRVIAANDSKMTTPPVAPPTTAPWWGLLGLSSAVGGLDGWGRDTEEDGDALMVSISSLFWTYDVATYDVDVFWDSKTTIELKTSIAASWAWGSRVVAGGPLQECEYQSLSGARAKFSNARYYREMRHHERKSIRHTTYLRC